jgi:hypothetical protein
MWMEERMGKKMNTERTDEALASASDTLAVGCPFCNIMLSDGVQERHSEMAVRDVAQILLQSIEFHPESSVAAGRNGNGDGYEATRDPQEVAGTAVGPDDPQTT